jgi:mono/diheme cytochrome c family protein
VKGFVIAAALVLAGCGSSSRRPPLEVFSDMRHQDKYRPQGQSAFFADGRASRGPVPGTVARGFLEKEGPAPLTKALLLCGQERFNIYCAPCHDRTGSGQGIVAQRGGWIATNLVDDRVRQLPDAELFDIISHGKRSMPPYRFQIVERDRWAVVAYVRALQRAASGTIADVPVELRSELR